MILPDRIFLVGLPGAGKSTAGKYLAKELGYLFVDLDEEIQKIQGTDVRSIFKNEGENRFREIESEALHMLTGQKIVVATGGGAPCFHGNMDWMNANGFTVFLNPPLDIIIDRISNETHRPLIGENPKETLMNLFETRKAFYNKSGMESDQLDPCEILAELLQYLRLKVESGSNSYLS